MSREHEREICGQIGGTRAWSQRIVGTSPLCRLQLPVHAKSSAEDLPPQALRLCVHCSAAARVFARQSGGSQLVWLTAPTVEQGRMRANATRGVRVVARRHGF